MQTVGHLYQRGKGGWWYLRRMIQGVVHTEALFTQDFMEAERIRRERAAGVVDTATKIRALEIELAKLKGEAIRSRYPQLADMADAYASHPDRWPGCQQRIADVCKALAAWYPKAPMDRIDRAQAGAFLAYMAHRKTRPCTQGTLVAHVSNLARVWRVLAPELQNPWSVRYVRLHFPVNSWTHRRLTIEECRAIYLSAAPGEERGVILTGYSTGLRLKDVCLLRWGSVDVERKLVRVIPAKTARHKTAPLEIPCTQELADWLALWKAASFRTEAEHYVFPTWAATYMRRRDFATLRLRRIFRRAGVKDTQDGKASFHSFRTTWQTQADEALVSRVISRKVLGHSSMSMSDTYSRLDVEVAREAVQKAVKPLAG